MTRMSTKLFPRLVCLLAVLPHLVVLPGAIGQDHPLAAWLKRLQASGTATPVAAVEEPNDVPPSNGATVTRRPSGLIDIHVRNAPIAAILEMLSYEFQLNIVSTNGVDQRVSANLYAVSLEEALEAILKPRQYTFHRSGKVIYVGTLEELAAMLPPPETRVFYVQHLSLTEAARAARARGTAMATKSAPRG